MNDYVQLTLLYDPALLDISSVAPGPTLAGIATTSMEIVAAGVLQLTLEMAAPLQAGPVDLAVLTAQVPETPSYGSQHLLTIGDVRINDDAIPARGEAGLHVVSYPGDANGDRERNAADARLVRRVAVGRACGFSSYPRTDPVLLGDLSGNGRLSSTDAYRITQSAQGLALPAASSALASASVVSSSLTESTPASEPSHEEPQQPAIPLAEATPLAPAPRVWSGFALARPTPVPPAVDRSWLAFVSDVARQEENRRRRANMRSPEVTARDELFGAL